MALLPWNEPIHLGADDDMKQYEVEGDMCLLPSGIIIVMVQESGWYRTPMWAIRPTSPPTVGPMCFSGNQYGEEDGGFEIHFDDINFAVPCGENTFAIMGEAASGPDFDNGAVAIILDVDPDTLVITQRVVVKAPWTEYYSDECNAATWQGDKVVIMPAQIGITSGGARLGIVTASGGFSTLDVIYEESPSARPGTFTVVGDRGLFAKSDGTELYGFDLPGGGGVNSVPWPGWGSWSDQSCPLDDGTAAFLISKIPGTGGSSAHSQPWVLIVDPVSLEILHEYSLPFFAREIGFTGGWYSNVRSISQLPDGNLLVGLVVGSNYFVHVFEIDGTSVVHQEVVPDFSGSFGANTFVYQAVPTGLPNGIAVMKIHQRGDGLYGAWYTQTYRGVANGRLDRTERRFVHRADRD